MENHTNSPRWGLLLARGALYILMGAFLFVFASTYTTQSGQIIGGLALLAGLCQLFFSFTHRGTESNNMWGILHGIADVGFGIAIYAYAKGSVSYFADTLGCWAMLYAFLQSVQAMYAFMAARAGTGVNLRSELIHFANVVVAGALTYMVLFRPAGPNESLAFVGLFPIILGVLICILTQQMKAQAANRHSHRMS